MSGFGRFWRAYGVERTTYKHPSERWWMVLVAFAGVADGVVFLLSAGLLSSNFRAYVLFDLIPEDPAAHYLSEQI